MYIGPRGGNSLACIAAVFCLLWLLFRWVGMTIQTRYRKVAVHDKGPGAFKLSRRDQEPTEEITRIMTDGSRTVPEVIG